MELYYYIIIIAGFALFFALIQFLLITRKSSGTPEMKELSHIIHKGAMTFLHKEYLILIVFTAAVFCALFFLIGKQIAIAFTIGAVFSAFAGNLGMRIATKANAKTAYAVEHSTNRGLRVAFASGTVMGMSVVGLGLLGVALLYFIFKFPPKIIYGFGFGASSIAIFARVGGGIYTKAADVGADLVGKVEAGIPEDDPRNPAVIADNVGDNVGDVAGMGADLFESYVDSIIAAMVIGLSMAALREKAIILPMLIAAIGIVSSIIGSFFVRVREGKDPSVALDKGIFMSSGLMGIGSYFAIKYFTQDLTLFYSTLSGLISGLLIGLSTEYFTSNNRKPAKMIAKESQTGAGTNIIQGIAVGMLSTIIPVVVICAAIFLSFHFAGLYGIAIAAVGMLSTLGITLATDSYGPVADNAAGIAEMTKLGEDVRRRAESLDAVGNTTAAIGKGFAIGSAALTALALFVSYTQVANISLINLTEPHVVIGIFIGTLLPFIFSALSMRAVGIAAYDIVNEVRRQFKEISGLIEGTVKPDYKSCIKISTHAALKQMILPSILAIIVPILVGKFLGVESLGGLLVGATATGFLLAIFMANSGGAWDNAKKYIEEGNYGGKGSFAHKAAVVGDTVGDPFKDTSGPSLNILIKLISIVALVFLPLFL